MKMLYNLLNSLSQLAAVRKASAFSRVFTVFLLCSFTIVGYGRGIAVAKDSTAGKSAAPAFINPSPVLRLEIHHININNGDASVIRLRHKDGTETKVLIDGGQTDPATYLLPYINAMFKDNHFEFTILTHYHNDHYKGLTALGSGAITSNYYIDLGGYNMEADVEPSKLDSIQPKDIVCPWTDSTGVFEKSMATYLKAIGDAANSHGLKRYMPMSKDGDHISDLIGVIIPLGQFDNKGTMVPIQLRCVAAWGFTQGNNVVVDNWKSEKNKNDPTLAFVLECGEFRYFFGGDMGGDNTGNYIDQETTLAAGFAFLYKGSKSFYNPAATYDGHICGFKANHHGSAHSNNSTFLGRMRAAVCVTSAGDNKSWHLPSVPFIKRLNVMHAVTLAGDIPPFSPPMIKAQGFFFTNLSNFGGENDSQTEAKKLFDKRAKTAFGYGGDKNARTKAGYEVFVLLNNSNINFTTQSSFGVVDVALDYEVSPIIAAINCHQK